MSDKTDTEARKTYDDAIEVRAAGCHDNLFCAAPVSIC